MTVRQLITLFAGILIWNAGALAHADGNDEKYGLGVLMVLTGDGNQFGGFYIQPHFEAELTMDASVWNSKQSTEAANEDLGVTGRLGYRTSIGAGNSLSIGLHYHESFFGKDGVAGETAKEMRFGPYIGFKRYWSGSSVYFEGFILPVSYQTNKIGHTDGSNTMDAQFRIFQEGGFGIGYVF